MTFDTALRASEILMALAFIQQSAEHLTAAPRERIIFALRIILSALLLAHLQTAWVLLGLLVLGLWALHLFQGPYNGGSDRMSLLILACLCAIAWVPDPIWQHTIYAYLGFQVGMSYFISGWVKLKNPEWRSGLALADVFHFSAYPVSEDLRRWANAHRILTLLSWGVILFEVLFPLAFLSQTLLMIALILAAGFHLSNACLFGLNRFFWIWLAAYPAILWLQDRLI
ncbi:vitamin K-dependent gamma-carboxylase-like protein [Pacificibacter maritimus]|uniref:Vitamin K-dependent gamma-carboxylase-like protein n=1 Tax=Pacificibacter maritimus TaxID=762213 RepID=A0A3N4V4R5_9RHOB|nr:HTTM domain-containing protein [Pacificibacter maritimus]RPE72107.1 vitamin K-dependent gamma-carboxylase-like protein [Pacificibacter maritimus]